MVLHFVDHNVARAQTNTMKPVVIVAGVGTGIGTSIARAFGAEGFAIALLARDSARLAKRHAEMTTAGITAAPFIVDLADSAATLNAVEQVRTWAGRDPSSLVYNAFALQQGSADQLDLAESQRAMRVNFIAATQLTALVAAAMRSSGTGSLLFTGGGAALHPYAGLLSLCAGKAALRMWVLTLAQDLAGTGVRVGTVTVHGRVVALLSILIISPQPWCAFIGERRKVLRSTLQPRQVVPKPASRFLGMSLGNQRTF